MDMSVKEGGTQDAKNVGNDSDAHVIECMWKLGSK